MEGLRVVKTPLVLVVCLGLVWPVSWVEAGQVSEPAGKSTLEMSNVTLGARGTLQGVVVDVDGMPQPNSRVVLVRQKQEIGRVKTDRLGHFQVPGLRGGVYMLQCGGQGRFVQAWTPKAAPPAAKPMALIVVGDGVVRGQMPLEEFFASDAIIIVGLVAAMIAIPIALNNRGDSSPASP